MSIPYLPGIGDTLQASLPKFGEALSKIARPFQSEQDLIRQMLISSPEKLDEYIYNEQQNPGVSRGIAGKGFEGMVSGRETSADFRIKKERTKLARDTDVAQLAKLELDKTRAKQLIAQRDGQLEYIKTLRETDPEMARAMWEQMDMGTTQENIDNLRATTAYNEFKTQEYEDSKSVTEPFIPQRLDGDYKGQPRYTPQEAALYMSDTPVGNYAKAVLNKYWRDQENQLSFARSIMLQDRQDQRRTEADNARMAESARKALEGLNRALAGIQDKGKNAKFKSPDAKKNAIEAFNVQAANASQQYGVPHMRLDWDDGGFWRSGRPVLTVMTPEGIIQRDLAEHIKEQYQGGKEIQEAAEAGNPNLQRSAKPGETGLIGRPASPIDDKLNAAFNQGLSPRGIKIYERISGNPDLIASLDSSPTFLTLTPEEQEKIRNMLAARRK